MLIPKIACSLSDVKALDQAFAQVEAMHIDRCNWAKEFSYAPTVTCRMFHTGSYLLLRFEVEEQYTAARVTEDNGEVWTDSCVEFFLALDQNGYYNFETTCIGRMLLGYRRSRLVDVVHASQEVIDTVQRIPSLPAEPFEECVGDNRWSMTLAIPATALFRHNLTAWDGVEASINLFKCGDKLSHPHFLSWQPIQSEKPNFHLPEFFKNVKFDK